MRPAAPEVSGRSLLDDCVHCGFCLAACPTYQSWGEEMDSPRGRIDLMRGLASGALALDAEVVRHFDRCLGCMGCVPACPSGVKYDVLIEETRAHIEERYERGGLDSLYRWLLFTFFPYPRRLRALAGVSYVYAKSGLQTLVRWSGVLALLPRRLGQLEALMPEVEAATFAALPPLTAATSPCRYRVALVAGCVQSVFFPRVHAATLSVLAAEGCDVVVPAGQGCCGALSIHAGRAAESKEMARALIESFENETVDAIIVNAAGCGSNLKDYGRLFANDPVWAARAVALSARVKDVTEFLDSIPRVAVRHEIPLRVAYHDACHLAHAQRIRQAPRTLLGEIPGLTLLEIPDGDQCCGSAGIYNLIAPEAADEIGRRKTDNVLATKADLLASANPGCALQIRKLLFERGASLPMAHPIEILAASLSGAPLP